MNSFEPNKLIKECIEKRDIVRLRATVTGILVRDRNSSTGDFESNVDYIVNKCGIKELIEEFDSSKPLVSKYAESRKLTDEDFSDAIYYLKKNFCTERIHDVISIGRELYPKTVDEYKKEEEEKAKQERAIKQKKKEKIAKVVTISVAIIILAFLALKILR